jgi:hypothetical protein
MPAASRHGLLLPLACLLAAAFTAAPQARAAATGTPERLRHLLARMHQAHLHLDWKEYRTESAELVRFLNGSPDAMLELARADARGGHVRAAMQQLTAIAQMGVSQLEVGSSPDFSNLRTQVAFRSILREMAVNAKPVSDSRRAFVIPDAGLLPEDLAFDPSNGRFLLTSVREARIVAIVPGGRLSTFARAPDGWPMLAIKIDVLHRVLWATEAALTGFHSVPQRDWGRSVILEYDLETARLLRRIEGPAASQLGDMTLSPAGDLLVADSNKGGLYLLRHDDRRLVRLNTNEFVSPMTPAFVSPHQALIADYVRGIALLDLGTGRAVWLAMAEKYALEGTDGLYRYQGRLIAIQNGLAPERVMSFTLDAGHARISAQKVIESGTPDLDPTHGVIVAGSLYYIANSGWNELTSDGSVRRGATLTRAFIMRTRL